MAATAFDRFVWWFAYHLSNFQFRWSWEDWDSCLQRDSEHPRPKFIREVLLKALRSVYYKLLACVISNFGFNSFLLEILKLLQNPILLINLL